MQFRGLILVPVTAVVLGTLLAAAQSRPAAAPATVPGHTDVEYLAHVARISRALPGFTVVVQKPFVMAGDDVPEAVRATGVRTVKWAVDHLKQDFLAKDPVDLIDIYLFKDKASYDRYTKDYFKDPAISPYGYYSPTHKALIMNISTGGGTLVHEIVHPFMAANFPACPTWFNEGLASLYEQSEDRGGHIHGRTNWRLAGLQQAIKAKSLSSFKDLCATTATQFYNQDRGANYAQARYLCYYLQEKGVLGKFYREFAANHKADPTGYKTLQRVLGEADMGAFQKNWEEYVLGLRFP